MRNLASIDPVAFREELRQVGVNNWPAPPPDASVDDLIDDFYSAVNPVKTFKVRRDTPSPRKLERL